MFQRPQAERKIMRQTETGTKKRLPDVRHMLFGLTVLGEFNCCHVTLKTHDSDEIYTRLSGFTMNLRLKNVKYILCPLPFFLLVKHLTIT